MFARILTGLILAPIAFSLVALGPLWGIQLFFSVLAVIGANEFMSMVGNPSDDHFKTDSWTAMGLVGLLVGTVAFGGSTWAPLALASFPMLGLLILLLNNPNMERVGGRALALLGALGYVGGLFSVFSLLTHLPGDWARWSILVAFFTVWPGDTFAYFAGRAIGGKKLYPRVSPKKTWAGAFGGLFGSIFGLFVLRAVWVPEEALPTAVCVGLGLACGVLEQAGDLCESLFKRSFGVKDSGSLLPGHGGILDRLDGLLFAGPVLLAYVTLAQ